MSDVVAEGGLFLDGAVLAEIEELCRASRPRVARGVLLGLRDPRGARVAAHWSPLPVEGDGGSRVVPRDWLEAEDRGRERGLGPVGTYHAHLDRDEAPTDLDHEDALEDGWLLIVAVGEGGATRRAAYRRRLGSDWLESSPLSVEPAG